MKRGLVPLPLRTTQPASQFVEAHDHRQ